MIKMQLFPESINWKYAFYVNNLIVIFFFNRELKKKKRKLSLNSEFSLTLTCSVNGTSMATNDRDENR